MGLARGELIARGVPEGMGKMANEFCPGEGEEIVQRIADGHLALEFFRGRREIRRDGEVFAIDSEPRNLGTFCKCNACLEQAFAEGVTGVFRLCRPTWGNCGHLRKALLPFPFITPLSRLIGQGS